MSAARHVRRHWLAAAVSAISVECLPAAAGARTADAARARAGSGSTNAGASPPPAASPYPEVRPGVALRFPQDHGAHPAYRIEWWYLTGWLSALPGAARKDPRIPRAREPFGFQLTFFRVRNAAADPNPSRFAPRQLLFAHAALAFPDERRLLVDERAARAGTGPVSIGGGDTGLAIRDWVLRRDDTDRYHAHVSIGEIKAALTLTPTAPPFAQGEAGYSRKGTAARQASYYYSRPYLRVSGTIGDRAPMSVDGEAWLDHEWSSEVLDERAVGWDWCGLHLDGGLALMAFRIRARDGGTLFAHARWVGAEGLSAARPTFTPISTWRSLRTGIDYPIPMSLRVSERAFELRPLFDDQELDTRASTGTRYWEGAVRVFEHAREIGRGYLELTGYGEPLRM